ncbi:MAG TPA: hypothetical protein VHH15_09685 [Actinophytocola sp.]|nr:hypothetical protein [Actinophytocola sp.]
MAELGALVGTYPTNWRRRWSAAVILLFPGVVLTAVGTVLLVGAAERAGTVYSAVDPLLLPIALVTFGAVMLLMGALFGVWARYSRGEVFRLHEHGLVHVRADTSRTIRWSELEDVVTGPTQNTVLARWAGGTFRCTVTVTGGTKVLITGLTENAPDLAQHLLAASRRGAQGR